MTEDRLLERLSRSEDPWLERKESFGDREARKAIVAFANSVPEEEPAALFIDASNRGIHPGIDDADGVQGKVLAQAQQNSCTPITILTKVLKPVGLFRDNNGRY